MSSLKDLYQEVIVDHNKSPRNFHEMPNANYHAEGYNPLCGDHFTVYLHVDDNNIIQSVSFVGQGCAISTASASLMTEALTGKSLQNAEDLFEKFHDLLTKEDAVNLESFGKLAVLAGVREFPARVKCATLAWHALHAALHRDAKPVSTE
jgi:nitrogen fixation protein NifU and related proteins